MNIDKETLLKDLDKCSKQLQLDIRKLKIRAHEKRKKLEYIENLLKAYEHEETPTL